VRTRAGLPAADIQFHMGAAYYEDHGQEEFDGHAIVIAPELVSPQARGQVWLRSSKPSDKPRIVTNAMAEPEDVESLVAAMSLAREIASQGPLAEITLREMKPGPGVTTREDMEADIRRRLMLIYHPVGTCRMGSGEGAVVDSELRVRGVEGPACGGRLGDAGDPGRQHQRPHDHGGREGERPDPRPRAGIARRGGGLRRRSLPG